MQSTCSYVKYLAEKFPKCRVCVLIINELSKHQASCEELKEVESDV